MEDAGREEGGAANAGDAATGSFIPLSRVALDASVLRAKPAAELDPETLRTRLSEARGPEYWRSLDELAQTEEFRQYLEREFPRQAPQDMEPLSRRNFIKLMGATLALAGAAGCAYQPQEKIVPYVRQPEDLILGKPLFYATSVPLGGYGLGLLARSNEGRPTKLEGNPDHPASLGATSAIAQGTLLALYDPDRSQVVRNMGDSLTWDNFTGAMLGVMADQHGRGGAGLRILTETVTSPTLASQLQALLTMFPGSRWHQHEPVSRDSHRAGARLAFGEDVHPVYHFDRATVILSLDSDFLLEDPGSVRYARDFADGRRVRAAQTRMNRLYSAGSTPTITSAMADHHLPLRAGDVEALARAVAGAVGVAGLAGRTAPPSVPADWLAALVKDLQASHGASLVVAGAHQPPNVHAIAHAINDALGNGGKTVDYVASVEPNPVDQAASLRDLVTDMQAGRVDMLVILGSNPVYTAPADLPFADAMDKVALRIHLGLYDDETGVLCQWHIPQSHYLEAWSDARAYDGTAGIIQPLIFPMYESRSAHELLAVLLGQGSRQGYDIVRSYWESRLPGPDKDKAWQVAVHDGVIAGTAAPAKTVALKPDLATAAPGATPTGLEVIFRPDPTIWDGRYANNGWLQELPKPLTQLTWDNAVLISPDTAAANQLSNGNMVEISYRGRTLNAPVWIMVGHPDDSVTLPLGYGRTRSGRLGTGIGFNAYAIRTSDAPGFGSNAQMRKTGDQYQLVSTQHHHSMFGRDFVQVGAIGEFAKNPQAPSFFHRQKSVEQPNLYPPMWPSDRQGDNRQGVPTYKGQGYNGEPIPAWGLVIDTNTCIGCNACTIACQSENNIATVGKDQVANNREMHWIRIDTYFRGEPQDPEMYFEPVPCMQCEKAPCEPVCPVEATTHSVEGINEMTYNRCIGTRYCSNNCPYKVRRFNFFQYADLHTPSIQMMQNPDVTVRARGVMEKCNYCVQRVNEGRIQAEKEERPIRDGDVRTACQQVCPTAAIVFGNINDTASNNGKGSAVRGLKAEPLNYSLLTELNTRPRTTYLARLRNPNPEIPPAANAGVDLDVEA